MLKDNGKNISKLLFEKVYATLVLSVLSRKHKKLQMTHKKINMTFFDLSYRSHLARTWL